MAEKKNDNQMKGLAVGAGIISAIATGYFLYGPKGKENRKKIRAWTIKAKGEVLSEIEKMKDVTEESYQNAIDKTTAKYSKLKDVSEDEIQSLSAELKKYWKNILRDQKSANASPKTTKKTGKKKTDN